MCHEKWISTIYLVLGVIILLCLYGMIHTSVCIMTNVNEFIVVLKWYNVLLNIKPSIIAVLCGGKKSDGFSCKKYFSLLEPIPSIPLHVSRK